MQIVKNMTTVTLNKGKLTKAYQNEEKILDFILYNWTLGNAVTNNELIYKFWIIN